MFVDRLIKSIKEKRSYLCVGLDPIVERIPEDLLKKHTSGSDDEISGICSAIYEFNCGIIDACQEFCVCVKPQMAYFEIWGHRGFHVFEKIVKYARARGLFVIVDAKRNDIASTAEAYAEAFLGDRLGADALTVNPYPGSDGIKPFTSFTEKGVFIVLKTSNPSSREIQMIPVKRGWPGVKGESLFLKIADLINKWGSENIGKNGFSNVGAVVGGTFPGEAKILRKRLPHTFFLVPGLGIQGGKFRHIPGFFNADRQGAIISLSRDINYAYQKSGEDYKKAAAKRAKAVRDRINNILKKKKERG